MKHLIHVLFFALIFQVAQAQTNPANRTIKVTGSSEMYIEPDEFILNISIKEYWKEEFEKRSEYRGFRNKVPISLIENELMADLVLLGIPKNNIRLSDAGGYDRRIGKEFLVGKTFEIKLNSRDKVDDIFTKIDTKGIEAVYISEMRNAKLEEYRKLVKIDALKAARNKADYLLKSIDASLGEVISIEETSEQRYWGGSSNQFSNSTVSLNQNEDSGLTKIKLRYEIIAVFGIK
jgi:hypothetical protein